MNDSTQEIGTVIILVFVGFLLWTVHDSAYENGKMVGFDDGIEYSQENNEELDICTYQLEEYQAALSEANDTIENSNSEIEFAQLSVYESCSEIRSALESLQVADTVDEP